MKPLPDDITIKGTIYSKDFRFYENFTYKNLEVPYSVLGSNIFFDINSTNINEIKDILIPVMCPVMRKVHDDNDPAYMPFIGISCVNFVNYNNIKKNSTFQQSVNENNKSNFFAINEYYIDSKNNNQNSNFINFPVRTSIKFNPITYTDTDKLYILPAAPTFDSPNGFSYSNSNNCSAFSLLISEKLEIIPKNPTLKLFNSSEASFYLGNFSKGQIYFNGFPFKRMLFAKLDQEYTMSAFHSTAKLENAIYISGVKRPLVNDFYNVENNQYNFLNILAFQCTSFKRDSSGGNFLQIIISLM